jgi:DNA polymerase III alpha subunit
MDNTTFGYVKFEKICREKGIRPIFGLRAIMCDTQLKTRSKYETCNESEEVYLIATSQRGISELYKIYTKSTEQKYYFNRIYPENLEGTNLYVISNKFPANCKRDDICIPFAKYSSPDHISTYQCISGSRGVPTREEQYLSDLGLLRYWTPSQIDKKNAIPHIIDDYELPRAGMIKYNGKRNFMLACWSGFTELGFDEDGEYGDRLSYEIDMIMSKNFQDYFLIVSDMITKARETMITGPGRGSSGGSLVCYCLGITNIDPLRFGLIFERFIDINRSDFPDIDTDYPDTTRPEVLKQVARQYKSAAQLCTITTYQPKTVINDFAKEYHIPAYELNELKDSIIERSSGDARAKACLADTFEGTEIGKKFLEQHPYMISTTPAEAHARHSGKHPAGIIVLDEDINHYAAYDHNSNNICMEYADAESIGLLKIDVLGLRTLSVIQNCLELSGVDINEIYTIDLEDSNVLDVFNTMDMSDIFQFDGDAIRMVNSRICVSNFSDLAAITALGRPGALNSGGTNRYIKVASGEEEPIYYGELYERVTKPTHGIVVYQEQTMLLLKEYGDLSWNDVNIMRRIISKSRGKEFFSKYMDKFIAGAIKLGHAKDEDEAMIVWTAVSEMGSYAFNKSHAVGYAMISYWCAHCKLEYPLNWLASNLNNAKDSGHGLRMLRKYVEIHPELEYVPVDPDTSEIGWTIQDGVLIGGLTNIHGIAEIKAKELINKREMGIMPTPAMFEKLCNPITDYDELYPMAKNYKHIYDKWDITKIEDLSPGALAVTIGRLTMKDLRDRNDVQSLMKRGGKRVEENTHYLNLIIEDDTGAIKCTLAPFDMDQLEGLRLAEELVVGSVVAVHGQIREGWQTISIKGVSPIEDL